MCFEFLLKRIVRIGISLAIIFVLWSCDKTDFDEYPPSVHLSKGEQENIIDKFIYARNDYDSAIDKRDLDLLRDMYKLRYYTKAKNKEYFLISYKGHFFSNGLLCYGGEINNQIRDSIFNIHFTERASAEYGQDTVKLLYKKMLEK